MPSASTTADSKAVINDPIESFKQAVQVIEKKIRNLEKRKQKLDGTREKLKTGEVELNADQREAINRINIVEGNLELARELKGQLQQLQTDTEKAWTKQQKREKRERQLAEMERFQGLMIVNDVLNNMGDESVRADFKDGNNGAVKLSEEDLSRLDDLHVLINPERDDENDFKEKLKTSSEHVVSLLDGKDKEVLGTTYKQLKTLIDSIYQCPYWSKVGEEEAVPEQVAEVVANGESMPDAATPDNEYVDADDGLAHVEPTVEHLESDVAHQEPLNEQSVLMNSQSHVTADSAYYAAPKQRAFNEIVSSVQGNFNFLQDSQIEAMSMAPPEAAHIDPAILHAQPRQMPVQDPSLSGKPAAPYQPYNPEHEPQAPAPPQTFYSSMVHEQRTGQSLGGYSETPDKPEPIPMPNKNKLMVSSFASATAGDSTSDSYQSYPMDSSDGTNLEEKEGDVDQDGFQSWGPRGNRGPRGGNRGNQRGGGQNGYRGNQRGGSGGGNYNNGQAPRGGGGGGAGGRGGRGGSWQGFPPRDNYRPEGGYQGYQREGREPREPRDGQPREGGFNNKQPRGNGGNRGGEGQRERGGRGGGFGARGGGSGQRGGGSGGAPRGQRNNNNFQHQQQQNVQQSA